MGGRTKAPAGVKGNGRAPGKYNKHKRGGPRQFSEFPNQKEDEEEGDTDSDADSDTDSDAESEESDEDEKEVKGEGEGKQKKKGKKVEKGEKGEDEAEDEGDSEEGSEEGKAQAPRHQGNEIPSGTSILQSRMERRGLKKQNKGDKGAKVDEEDRDLINPNHLPNKGNIANLSSRSDRDREDKEAAKERYWKLHLAGKTDEAKSDLARLARVREERASKEAKRRAEQEAKAAELKAAQSKEK